MNDKFWNKLVSKGFVYSCYNNFTTSSQYGFLHLFNSNGCIILKRVIIKPSITTTFIVGTGYLIPQGQAVIGYNHNSAFSSNDIVVYRVLSATAPWNRIVQVIPVIAGQVFVIDFGEAPVISWGLGAGMFIGTYQAVTGSFDVSVTFASLITDEAMKYL